MKNFRSDNFHHLKPKLIEVTERPPDEFLRNKKRNDQANNELDKNELDNIMEENSINDETVLIDKNPNVDETYDRDEGEIDHSSTHQSDHDFEQEFRENIDRQGMRVGSREGLSKEEEERRRLALLAGLDSQKTESVHSRISSSQPEANSIAFQDPNLAMLNSEGSGNDADSEAQDMVFYLKEDQTQYSKPLGLNKAPRKSNEGRLLSDDGISGEPSLDGSKLFGDQLPRGAISDIAEEANPLNDGSLFGTGDGGITPGDGGLTPGDGRLALGEDGLMPGDGGNGFGGGDGINGIGGEGAFFANPKSKSKRRKQKPKKLTAAQRRKMRKMNEIYGQDTEELGLSPRDERYYASKNKKLSNKKKDGKKTSLSGDRKKFGRKTADQLRAQRFKGLNLNKPQTSGEGEYDILKRKLRRFRKRQDISFWLDYDSPYAEYLPHRFREWVPETKTGLELDENAKNKNANYKAMELSRIYTHAAGIPEEDKDGDDVSRVEKYNKLLPTPNKSSNNLRPKSNASMLVEGVDNLSSNKKKRGMTSSKRNKSSSKKSPERPPVIIDF